MTTRRISRRYPPLPADVAEDIQRTLIVLVDMRRVLHRQLMRLSEAEETLRYLVEEPPPLRVPLSPDEITVLRLLAQGTREAQIMEQVGAKAWTVRSRINRAIIKLGARSRAEAVLKAWKLGLI